MFKNFCNNYELSCAVRLTLKKGKRYEYLWGYNFCCCLNRWITYLEAELEQFYEDLQNLLDLTPKKDVLFIIGNWNAKEGTQETPGVTGKYGLGIQNEAGQRLIEFCQKNALVIANTLFQQHKRRLYTWTSPNGQH